MSDDRYKPRIQQVLTVCTVVIGVTAVAVAAFYPWDLGAKQPSSFSHRVHAGDKEIGCVMCHPGVLQTPVAGIPPVETCMLCHRRIIVHYPEIEKVRRSAPSDARTT